MAHFTLAVISRKLAVICCCRCCRCCFFMASIFSAIYPHPPIPICYVHTQTRVFFAFFYSSNVIRRAEEQEERNKKIYQHAKSRCSVLLSATCVLNTNICTHDNNLKKLFSMIMRFMMTKIGAHCNTLFMCPGGQKWFFFLVFLVLNKCCVKVLRAQFTSKIFNGQGDPSPPPTPSG